VRYEPALRADENVEKATEKEISKETLPEKREKVKYKFPHLKKSTKIEVAPPTETVQAFFVT